MLNQNVDTNHSGVLRIEKKGVKVEKITKGLLGESGVEFLGPHKDDQN